jgi:hypothetical protein
VIPRSSEGSVNVPERLGRGIHHLRLTAIVNSGLRRGVGYPALQRSRAPSLAVPRATAAGYERRFGFSRRSVNVQSQLDLIHGIEEVVGSIPSGSTRKSLKRDVDSYLGAHLDISVGYRQS